jgi:hypothetical protein
MTTAEVINTIINFFTALGTVGAVVVALRPWLWGPRLKIAPHNLKGALLGNAGVPGRTPKYCYLLKVVNSRPSVIATNCLVQVKTVWRRSGTGTFEEVPPLFPLILQWSPSEEGHKHMTIRREQVLDLGTLPPNGIFTLGAHLFPANFDGHVGAGQVLRFGLEIVADNFVSPALQVFEVEWNGMWSPDAAEMAKNVQIREVASGVGS